MQQTLQDTLEQSGSLQTVLDTCVVRISEGLKDLAQQGDWDAIKSVLRVIDAHIHANELRSQGQPARAHLWLVGVGRKPQKSKKMKLRMSPFSPSAA
jgi:hypothetical protein